MSRTYDDPDRETEFERHERQVDRELARRDRLDDYTPLPDKEPNESLGELMAAKGQIHAAVLDFAEVLAPSSDREVLPRDLEDYPPAQARVERLADDYASVEVDRLPPMGALHWLITGHKADGSVDTFRVGAHGSLMPWPVKP